MDKQGIIRELFSASPEMVDHLSEEGNCDGCALLNAICCAPIPLQRKLELLQECLTWNPELRNEELDPNEDFRERIHVLEQALSELEAKPGDIFLWRNCWYDRDWQDDVGNSGFEPCLSMPDVFAAIDAFIAFEAEDLTDEDRANGLSGDTGWYEVRKWESQIGVDGEPHLQETPWEYIIVDGEICYFRRRRSREEQYDWWKCRMYDAFDGSSNLNLSIPFQRGDIITVDCGQFAPVCHAVILDIGLDCCGVQIAYVDDKQKLQTAALKHSHCFTGNYLSKLSPLYRLCVYDGELEGNEKILKSIHGDIMRCNEEDRDAYCRGLWDAISRLGD